MQASLLLPVLARSRETLEESYAQAVEVAAKGPLPCVVLDAYRSMRDRQLRLENQLLAEVRTKGIIPPEQAPRSLATFGACSPGETETTLNPETLKLARDYVRKTKISAEAVDTALRKVYDASPIFAKHADALLTSLTAYARAGTSETSPAPANISLLRLVYYLGGVPWRIVEKGPSGGTPSEGEKLRLLAVTTVKPQEAIDLMREAAFYAKTISELSEARGAVAVPKKATSYWPLILGGGTTLVSVGLGLVVWKLAKREEIARAERYSFMEAEAEPERRALPPRRRRRRRARSVASTPREAAAVEQVADSESDDG